MDFKTIGAKVLDKAKYTRRNFRNNEIGYFREISVVKKIMQKKEREKAVEWELLWISSQIISLRRG